MATVKGTKEPTNLIDTDRPWTAPQSRTSLTTLTMWLQVSLAAYLSCVAVASYGPEAGRASLRRSRDPRDGGCRYTFTVAAPAEAAVGCPGDETEGVLSRVVLLEALVSRLVEGQEEERGSGTGGTGAGGPKGVGPDGGSDGSDHVYSRVTSERNQLQEDKERLSGQVQELLRRVEQLGAEAESLRQKPCQRDQARPDHRPSGSTYLHGPP